MSNANAAVCLAPGWEDEERELEDARARERRRQCHEEEGRVGAIVSLIWSGQWDRREAEELASLARQWGLPVERLRHYASAAEERVLRSVTDPLRVRRVIGTTLERIVAEYGQSGDRRERITAIHAAKTWALVAGLLAPPAQTTVTVNVLASLSDAELRARYHAALARAQSELLLASPAAAVLPEESSSVPSDSPGLGQE